MANSGISGNRVLLDSDAPGPTIYGTSGPSALTRLTGDVLERAGARTVIALEGINDMQQTPHQTDPREVIAGPAQISAQAKARGRPAYDSGDHLHPDDAGDAAMAAVVPLPKL